MIEFATDAVFLNHVFNHPEVRPWVADVSDGVLDLTPIVQKHVALVGEHGATCYTRFDAGIFMVHTAVLPEGRGEWAKNFAAESVRRMFVATDAVEILTRVPRGHIAAKALTLATGFREQFETPPECLFRGQCVPATIYNLMIQDWWTRAEYAEQRGAEFHDWMNRQIGHAGAHDPDPVHNRLVGVCLEMIGNGRINKAVALFNRWALSVRHTPVSIIGTSPVQIKFDAGILTYDGQFHIEPLH